MNDSSLILHWKPLTGKKQEQISTNRVLQFLSFTNHMNDNI